MAFNGTHELAPLVLGSPSAHWVSQSRFNQAKAGINYSKENFKASFQN